MSKFIEINVGSIIKISGERFSRSLPSFDEEPNHDTIDQYTNVLVIGIISKQDFNCDVYSYILVNDKIRIIRLNTSCDVVMAQET